MKKTGILFFTFTFFILASLHAQQWSGNNNTTDPIYRSGNVGIGTSLPAYNLDVQGSVFGKGVFSENESSLTSGRAVLNSYIGTYNPATSSSLNATTFQAKCQTEDGTMAVNNTSIIQAMKFSFVHKNNGTISELVGVRAQGGMPSGAWGGTGTSGTITSLKGFDVELWAEKGSVQYASGISLETVGDNISNICYLRIDQSTDINGNFAIYNASSFDNYIEGNVGIGVTNPGSKLSVNGNVVCREVEVTLNGWPDYVFSDDYNLMSLEETEAYIKEHKHLPGLPSADQVEESGVSLGEMNAILLKKIEELTLHIIEQQKQIERLSKEKD